MMQLHSLFYCSSDSSITKMLFENHYIHDFILTSMVAYILEIDLYFLHTH